MRLLSLAGGLAVAAACSQAPTPLTPAGPSPFSPAGGAGVGGWTASSASTGRSFALAKASGKKVSGAGTVASLTGTCPTLSMVVHGVRVVTDEDTEFFIEVLGDAADLEGGCRNLRPGTKVVVEAAEERNADGSYHAEKIVIIDQPGGPPPSPVEGDGTVAALKGTCPSLTMVVHGYPVMTVSATVFSGGGAADSTAACALVAPGTKVHVVGTLAGNSVVADTVEILATDTP